MEFAPDRYDAMQYRRCGRSGLMLPAVSLGAYETFGSYKGEDVARECLYRAFDLGITHFARRGQSLAQMALAWALRLPAITSVLVGASRVSQIEENVAALQNLDFTKEELAEIDRITLEPAGPKEDD